MIAKRWLFFTFCPTATLISSILAELVPVPLKVKLYTEDCIGPVAPMVIDKSPCLTACVWYCAVGLLKTLEIGPRKNIAGNITVSTTIIKAIIVPRLPHQGSCIKKTSWFFYRFIHFDQ